MTKKCVSYTRRTEANMNGMIVAVRRSHSRSLFEGQTDTQNDAKCICSCYSFLCKLARRMVRFEVEQSIGVHFCNA